jgi:hypothetical protein
VTLTRVHLPEEQWKVLRQVALAYRHLKRAPPEPAITRAEISLQNQRRENEARAAAKSVSSG